MPGMCTCNTAFDLCPGHPQLYKSLPTSCNKPLPVLAREQLRGKCPDADVQDLRFPLRPALLSGG